MSWEKLIFRTVQPGTDLSGPIEELLRYQRENWEMFREGEESLAGMRSKTFSEGGAQIVVQANPGRRKSTHARVDRKYISRRPCFLCAENIPSEERGIAFGDLVLLPNPHPVLPRHLTIPTREHLPQRLEKRIPGLFDLARALGQDMLVFYNGPSCGASAPDHFHFQACSSARVPLLRQLPSDGRHRLQSFGRRLLVCGDRDAEKCIEFVSRVLECMPANDPEPLINVLVAHRGGRYLAVVWPRSKHRPDCYFEKGEARIAVSPAAMEMAGILVVAEPDHFDRIDKQTAVSTYREVSLDAGEFDRVATVVTCSTRSRQSPWAWWRTPGRYPCVSRAASRMRRGVRFRRAWSRPDRRS
jgi:hypothetical protein